MSPVNRLSVRQAQILSELAVELGSYPRKRGHKKRFIPPELKLKIGKAVKALPNNIPATVPAEILGLQPSRIRLWAQGKGIGPVGGDQRATVEKTEKNVYAKKSPVSEGFNLVELQQIQSMLWDAVSAKPGQKAGPLASALTAVAAALARELQP